MCVYVSVGGGRCVGAYKTTFPFNQFSIVTLLVTVLRYWLGLLTRSIPKLRHQITFAKSHCKAGFREMF